MIAPRFINKNIIYLTQSQKQFLLWQNIQKIRQYENHIENMENIIKSHSSYVTSINQHNSQILSNHARSLNSKLEKLKQKYKSHQSDNSRFITRLNHIKLQEKFFNNFQYHNFNKGSNFSERIQKAKEIQKDNQLLLKRILKQKSIFNRQKDEKEFQNIMKIRNGILKMSQKSKEQGVGSSKKIKNINTLIFQEKFRPTPKVLQNSLHPKIKQEIFNSFSSQIKCKQYNKNLNEEKNTSKPNVKLNEKTFHQATNFFSSILNSKSKDEKESYQTFKQLQKQKALSKLQKKQKIENIIEKESDSDTSIS